MDENGGVGNGGNVGQAFPSGAANNGNDNGGGAANSRKLPQVLQQSFGEVQGILEHNRVLIWEISQNQESRDADRLTRNVALIWELNTNIARIVDLYFDHFRSFARSVAAKNAANKATGPKRPCSNEQ